MIIFFLRVVSFKVPDLHDEVIARTALLTMSPAKIELTVQKEASSDITWPKLHDETVRLSQ